MIVKCKRLDLSEDDVKTLQRMKIWYGGNRVTDLKLEIEYRVYGLAIINNVENYLLYDTLPDSDYLEWGWYPSVLFKVVDDKHPKNWKKYEFVDNDITSDHKLTRLLADKTLASCRDLYYGVCEKRVDIVKVVERLVVNSK